MFVCAWVRLKTFGKEGLLNFPGMGIAETYQPPEIAGSAVLIPIPKESWFWFQKNYDSDSKRIVIPIPKESWFRFQKSCDSDSKIVVILIPKESWFRFHKSRDSDSKGIVIPIPKESWNAHPAPRTEGVRRPDSPNLKPTLLHSPVHVLVKSCVKAYCHCVSIWQMKQFTCHKLMHMMILRH